MTCEDKTFNVATGEGLPHTPEDAVWNGPEVIGCRIHPKTSLIVNRQEDTTTYICNPGDESEAHVLVKQGLVGGQGESD